MLKVNRFGFNKRNILILAGLTISCVVACHYWCTYHSLGLTMLNHLFQATMAASQKFCLKWNNFQNSVTSVFDNLRQDEELVDITLCCEGKKIKAHRMMLSACSPYFRDLFKVCHSSQVLFLFVWICLELYSKFQFSKEHRHWTYVWQAFLV